MQLAACGQADWSLMDLKFGGVGVPAGGANAATTEAKFRAAPAVYPMQLDDNTSAKTCYADSYFYTKVS